KPPFSGGFYYCGLASNPRHVVPGLDDEAPAVRDEASRLWRSGQNSQASCVREFWAPQEGLQSNFESFCPCQKTTLLGWFLLLRPRLELEYQKHNHCFLAEKDYNNK
ncbi:MAG TPA: hypothetical protein PKW24_08560, partial [Clostridiales bacterium]|nr:hypothetical protein [Clostridiales bacterium]